MYISWGEAPEAQLVVVFYNQAELCFMCSYGVRGVIKMSAALLWRDESKVDVLET